MYKYKKTKKLIKQLKPFLEAYKKAETEYSKSLYRIETAMTQFIKIPNIEFIFCDNDLAGIGNADRTMELIQREDIENG